MQIVNAYENKNKISKIFFEKYIDWWRAEPNWLHLFD